MQRQLFCLFTCAWLLASASPPAFGQDDAKKSEPGPLQLRLIAKQNHYVLNPNNKSAVWVDLVLELKNTGDKEAKVMIGHAGYGDTQFWSGSDATLLTLDLKGPGAVSGRAPLPKWFPLEFFMRPKEVTLAPGASQQTPIKSLLFGERGVASQAYWTKPGEYTLTAAYKFNAGKEITLTSEPIKLRVSESEKGHTALAGHEKEITALAFSPDGKILASASADQTIRFWDASTGLALNTLPDQPGVVNCLAFSADGKTLAAASKVVAKGAGTTCEVRKWDLATGKPTILFANVAGSVMSLAFSPVADFLAVGRGGHDSQKKEEFREVVVYRGPRPLIQVIARYAQADAVPKAFDVEFGNALAFSADGKTLAVTGGSTLTEKSGHVSLWEGLPLKQTMVLSGFRETPRAVAFSSDGKTLAAAAVEGVKVWDVGTGKAGARLQGNPFFLDSKVVFLPADQGLLAAGNSGMMIWDAQTGEVRASWFEPAKAGYHLPVTVSADGGKLAYCYSDGSRGIALVDTATVLRKGLSERIQIVRRTYEKVPTDILGIGEAVAMEIGGSRTQWGCVLRDNAGKEAHLTIYRDGHCTIPLAGKEVRVKECGPEEAAWYGAVVRFHIDKKKATANSNLTVEALLERLDARFANAAETKPAPAVKDDADPDKKPPLELRLLLKKDSFVLNPGMSGEDYRKRILVQEKENGPGAFWAPPASRADITLEIRNTSDKAQTIYMDGDSYKIGWVLEGPGAISAAHSPLATLEFRLGKAITLEPGQTITRSFGSLEGGNRRLHTGTSWTEPGDYTLTAFVSCGGRDANVGILTSAPVKIKVVSAADKPDKDKGSKDKKLELSLTTGYLADAALPRVYEIRLRVTLDDQGGGKGALYLDPNRGKQNDFGDWSIPTTELRGRTSEVTLKQVQKDDPLKKGRRLYDLGQDDLFLVVSPDGAHRLLVKGKDGTRVIPLATATPKILPPCHPGCFPAGTPVLTPSGARSIETLKAGDVVLGVDAKGKAVSTKVRSVFVSEALLVEVETVDGSFQTTTKQPLCVNGGGIKTGEELTPGEQLLRWHDGQGQPSKIRAVRLTNKQERVFNLVLEDQEYFIAGGFLVRAKPPALAEPTSVIQSSQGEKSR